MCGILIVFAVVGLSSSSPLDNCGGESKMGDSGWTIQNLCQEKPVTCLHCAAQSQLTSSAGKYSRIRFDVGNVNNLGV